MNSLKLNFYPEVVGLRKLAGDSFLVGINFHTGTCSHSMELPITERDAKQITLGQELLLTLREHKS